MNEEQYVSDTVGKLLSKQQEEEKRSAINKERREEFSRALNHVFDSDDGIYVLNEIIKYCNITGYETSLVPAKLFEDNMKRKFFNKVFMEFLENNIKQKLEYY